MPQTRSCHLLAAVCLLGALSATASADKPRRVAVLVASQTNASEDIANLVAQALEKALASRSDVLVVPWSETSRMLSAAGANEACPSQPSCIRDLAGRIGADELLLVSLALLDDTLQVDITWGSGPTGKTATRVQLQLDTIESAEPKFRTLADLLPEPEVVSDEDAAEQVQDPSGRHFTLGFWIAGGTGAAALLASGTLGLIVRSRHGTCENRRDAGTPCSSGRLDSIDRTAVIADALLLTGVAAVATAGVLYLLSGGESRAEPATVAIDLVPGGAQVGIRGRF